MSNTSYKQIIPATDWYFRHDNVSGVAGKSTVYQLAAWALKENGEVVGLVTVRDDNGRPKLVTPPPVPGDYLHKERKRLARTVLIFTEKSDQLSRATDRVPGLPASPGYAQ